MKSPTYGAKLEGEATSRDLLMKQKVASLLRSQKTKFMVSDLMMIQMIPLNFLVSLMMCTTLKGIYIKNFWRSLLSFAIMSVYIKQQKLGTT